MKTYIALWELITTSSLDSSLHEDVYQEVVNEYKDMGDNPNDATIGDVYEIADASMI